MNLIILFFLLIGSCMAYDRVSFYGASFITVPLQEAKGVTDISFRLRTQLSDALLLLAAGKTDYCLIKLENGRIKLHINLGAGESELSSPKGLHLNDSDWHYISVIRREANLTMKVDETVSKKKLPGRFFELNIHFGVFLGGQGDFSDLFLGHMENFRGCMEDVYYNGVNMIEKARSRSVSVRVEGVTWNCAPEFDSDFNTDISFIEEGAYVIFSKINSRAGGRWQIEFKTIVENCVILYNAGGLRGYDFLAVEIIDGLIKVKMARGQILHTVRVNDGHWHKMHLLFNPSLIELSVDGIAMSTRIESGNARYLDLSDMFYIGGIDGDKRQRAFAKGIKAADSTLLGCIKPVEVDDRILGLMSASVTRGVSPKCVWSFPCHVTPTNPPCIHGAACQQHGVDHFTCKCDSELCINPDYAEKYKVYSKSSNELELVALDPLIVPEGGVSLITSHNIEVVFDHHKYGVRPSGVLLHVIQPPQYGRIAVDLTPRSPQSYNTFDGDNKGKQTFTLMDLSRDKVRYVHDGSERHQDSLVIEMELIPEARFTLPSYLQGHYSFALHVNITPVNDPPVPNFLPGRVLKITQGTRKVITSDIIKAEDPDTPPDALIYSIIESKSDLAGGHIEVSGQPVSSFTQQDIDAGIVTFAHNIDNSIQNKTSLKLVLQVSDGIETSAPSILRISIVPLQMRLVNNTGLQLVHNSYAIIMPENLTFTTNADDSNIEVRYTIVKPPQFGVIERLRVLDGTWQTVDSFTSEMITYGRVRYMHLLSNPAHDEFKFKASVGDISTNILYDFRLIFVKLELFQSINEELVLNNSREAFISPQNLRFETQPLSLPSEKIFYTVIRPPKYGILHLSSGKHHLQTHDSFTQNHINSNQLWYRLHRRAYSHVQDDFFFVVSASECENITGVMTIKHIPSASLDGYSSGRFHSSLERLQVVEGSRMIIPATHLNLRSESITNLIYNITRMPKHGKIEVVGDHQLILRDNTTYFTMQELNSDSVYYAHDDSESRHDSFHFMALSPEPEDFQYVGVFHVDVILRNDNSPVRVSGNVFHIVNGGARLITNRDLAYTDVDLDTKPSDIIFTTRIIPNGKILRADNPSEDLVQFSQEDINKNMVLFKHQGDEYGKMILWISDGVFDVNGVLEIQASPPFIRMCHSNGSIVENGKAVVITSRELMVDTNMNCLEEDIRYDIIMQPLHGALEVGEGEHSSTFTQLDVSAGRVAYRHTEPRTLADSFRFKVTCMDTWGEGEYSIKIYPSSYWAPLIVLNNKPVFVEESTSFVISRNYLEVANPQIEPSNIVFTVTNGPFHGWLEIITPPAPIDTETLIEQAPVKVFDQATINSNRLNYVQSGINRTRDKITMDITNGIVWLRDVELNIVIIPEHFYVSAVNLTVIEGNSISFKPVYFRTITEYFRGKVTQYKVLVPPKHGVIKMKGDQVTLLPVLKMNSGEIEYTHDGSEATQDKFTLIAIAGDKHSEAFTVYINVIPVNDETPIVTANTGLCVWEGGKFVLTRKELYVSDLDTPLENVTIFVVEIISGYMAMKSEPDVQVDHFTQADIDQRNVVFVHTDGSQGRMIFNVSDGVHKLSLLTFLITSKPVSLNLIRKQNLNVFPLMREPITQLILMSKCSDPERPIHYNIVRAPTLGRLVIISDDNHHRTLKQFTQSELNESLVFYEHTHPFSDLYNNDSFTFNIEAPYANTITDQIFNIVISVSSGGLAKYVHIPNVRVEEGEKTVIKVNITNVIAFLETQAGLRQPVVEAHITQPAHGKVIPFSISYSQAQLESGFISYQHDHSDTVKDKIEISLYLLPDNVLLCNVTIPITIIPINDQPFRLLTDVPSIVVVQGENYTITADDLYTEDADTPPSDIVYDIISGPTVGRIILKNDNIPISDALSINKFTQKDINEKKIVYEHSGPMLPATFYFRVWDGNFKPTYTVFTINVLPVVLNATATSPLYLQQGTNVVSLTKEHITVHANVRLEKIYFNITNQPKNGMLYVGASPVNHFTQKALEEKLVMYMQNDMTTANDSFEIIAYVESTAHSQPFTIKVLVQPLMLISDLKVEHLEPTKITLKVLDATSLSKLTSSDPIYSIVSHPKYGKIKKIIRSSGEFNNPIIRPAVTFSHEDIKSGIIYYVPKKSNAELKGLEDSVKFVLAASIFQPAEGSLRILLGKRGKADLPGPNDPEGHAGVGIVPGAASSYYMLILMILCGLVATVVIIVVIIKCRYILSQKQNALAKLHAQSQGTVAPIPLPRPPDHLMPSPTHGTPTIKRSYMSSENSMHTGASTPLGSMPQCKVTPLLDGGGVPPGDLNSRYPYGTEDHTDAEDWSSYEASENAYPVRTAPGLASNPMLRRNQYWV